MFFEFAAVVRQNIFDFIREHLHDRRKEVGKGLRRMRLGGYGAGGSGEYVDGG